MSSKFMGNLRVNDDCNLICLKETFLVFGGGIDDYIGKACRIARRLNAGPLVVERTVTRSLLQ